MRIHRALLPSLFVLLIGPAAAPAAALPGPDVAVPAAEPPGAPALTTPADPGPDVRAAQSGQALTGTFRVTAGACEDAVSGSYFRMIQPGGDAESGPWVENSNSPCADKTYTPLAPGTDGGLISGAYQPQPEQPFDAGGNGTATRIVDPANFFGVDFAVATNEVDPQTGADVTAPTVSRSGTSLSGDLRAVGVAWNRQHFNQGSPKPDGGTPGATTLPTGTIDGSTGAYTLGWTSTIVGGPFNNFTGLWHLEGTFDGDLGEAPAGGREPASPGGDRTPAGGGTPGAGASASIPNTGPGLPALGGLVALGLSWRLSAVRRHRHA